MRENGAALGLTLLVEVPLYTAALVGLFRVRWWRAALLGTGVNLLTHPLLWSGLWAVRHWSAYPLILIGAEAAVGLAEWALLRAALPLAGVRPRGLDSALLAAVAVGVNAASVLAGLLLPGAVG